MDQGFDFGDGLDDRIDLTPLIDVVFLLLLFFILATTFLKPVVDVILPTAESGTVASDQEQMVVTIDSQGQVFFDSKPVTRDHLPELLNLHRDLALNFMVDNQAPFQAFMDVLDQARIQGRENFIITTEPFDEQHP